LNGNILNSVLRAYKLQQTPLLDEIGPKFEKCPPGKTRFNFNERKEKIVTYLKEDFLFTILHFGGLTQN
jgi:hypothetical protein